MKLPLLVHFLVVLGLIRCKTQKVVVTPFLLNGEGDDGVKTLPFYTIR